MPMEKAPAQLAGQLRYAVLAAQKLLFDFRHTDV